MGKRILVGYATRTDSTKGIAEAVGSTLSTRGFDVDVRPLSENPQVTDYDAVVLGSAVNGGAWLSPAVEYVEANSAALNSVPTAVFCVHIMNTADDEKSRKKRLAYLARIRALINPRDEAYFAGVGPDKGTSFVMRWAFRAFGGGGEGDCRDWDKIDAWAAQLEL